MFVYNHWLRYQWEALLKSLHFLADVPRAEAWPQGDEPLALPSADKSQPDRPHDPDARAEESGATVIELPLRRPLPGHFDLTGREGGLPALPKGKRKNPPLYRHSKTITTLCIHQMAVRFGTTRARRKHWAKVAPALGGQIQALYQFEQLRVLQDAKALEAFAARRALHERMCGIPYHYAALLNGDRLKINPRRLYTYHGDKANASSVGLAVEGSFPGLESGRKSKHDELDGFMIETGRGLMHLAMMESEADGYPITHVTAHRVYSGGRLGDPGEAIWESLVLWAIREYGLKVDYNAKVGSGLPIPVEWDDNALFDYRGRRALKEAA